MFEYLFAEVTSSSVFRVNGKPLDDKEWVYVSVYANDRGREGWELVSTVPIEDAEYVNAFVMIFKRGIRSRDSL